MQYSGCGWDVDSKFWDPHISSSHPLWEDMHYEVSPNDKRWPSMLPCVAGLTSSRGPHVCRGTWLSDSPSLCVDGTNILLLVATPVCTNQLHTTRMVIFSWNPYPQSCHTHRDLIEIPGIHRYFGHYGTRVKTRVAHAGPGWTTTQVLIFLYNKAKE